MDTYRLREYAIAHVAKKLSGLSKTGMMKAMYLLQQVYKVPLNYEFSIYTYGPYDVEVLTYTDIAERDGLVRIVQYDLAEGSVGYKIYAKSSKLDDNFPKECTDAIDEIVKNFQDYTARKWELTATIVYVYNAHIMNGTSMDKSTLCNRVYELKPHFDKSDIRTEYDKLERIGFLECPS
ncbi:MAG: hypothetical protein FWH37_02010 [Candidatus Bathyarchaeota archaeon]|nr:hypothetical protein [Candidatus Termiticorpusculum sp.]